MKGLFYGISLILTALTVIVLGGFQAVLASDAILDRRTQELEIFDRSLSLGDRKILKSASLEERDHLDPRLQALWDERAELKSRKDEREKIVALKQALLELPGASATDRSSLEKEAETVAQVVIPAFADLKKQYEMVRPAVLHNLLVNVGLKHQGLCWHWTRDLTDTLNRLGLKKFDILWATARGGTPREHNSVVLVIKGGALQDGLVLDGWKKSGKPFWIRVPDDKSHPWKLGEYYGG